MTTQHKFELSQATQDALVAAYDALANEMQAHTDAFSERSERWQESEKGDAVQTWIDNFDGLLEDLDADNIETKPEDV